MAARTGSLDFSATQTKDGFTQYWENCDKKFNQRIDKFIMNGAQVTAVTDLLIKLRNARSEGKQFDFSIDKEAKKCAYIAHLRNPKIFEGKVHNLPVENHSLEQKLNSIAAKMREEKIPGLKIDRDSILERTTCDADIQFDTLDITALKGVIKELEDEFQKIINEFREMSKDTVKSQENN